MSSSHHRTRASSDHKACLGSSDHDRPCRTSGCAELWSRPGSFCVSNKNTTQQHVVTQYFFTTITNPKVRYRDKSTQLKERYLSITCPNHIRIGRPDARFSGEFSTAVQEVYLQKMAMPPFLVFYISLFAVYLLIPVSVLTCRSSAASSP